MQIKQSGGKVFGAVLTAKERKAMEIEINRQILEADRQYQDDIDAAVLWALHQHLGFGEKRLRDFYEAFTKVHDELRKYYECENDEEAMCIVHERLKRIGVDVVAWNKQRKE